MLSLLVVRIDSQRGLGLLEVLVGAFLLSMVVLGVSSVWIQHQRAYRQTRDRMVADFLLQREMERVVAGGFSGLPDIADEAPNIIEIKRGTPGGVSTVVYETDVSMSSNVDESIRKAVVEVKFPDRGGAPVTISAETDLFWSQ